jgi:hypothetical protein
LLLHPPGAGAPAGPGLAAGSTVFRGDLSTLHRTSFPSSPAGATTTTTPEPGELLLQIFSLLTQYPSNVVAHFQKGIDRHRSKALRPLGHFGPPHEKGSAF